MIGIFTDELGFSNILFVLAAGINYALEVNQDWVVTDDLGRIMPLLENKCAYKFVNVLPPKRYLDDSFEYKPIPKFDEDITLKYQGGYFQSPNYFHNIREYLMKHYFAPSFVVEHAIELKYPFLNKEETASVHVRRGNYVSLPYHHPVMSIEYYKEAIDRLPKSVSRIIVSSNDREWCNENFIFDKRIIIHRSWANVEHDGWNQSRWNWINGFDMYMMAQCTHNIIANSTFSWWSAYLNDSQNKKVFYPSKWFGPAYSQHKLDLIPDYLGWEKIEI